MSYRVVIKDDLYNIASRVKNIDDGYYIIYNSRRAVYEVHNDKTRDTLQLVLPYNRLDCRTLEYIRRTIIKNHQQFMREIEEHNDKINQSKIATSMDIIKQKVSSQVKYEAQTGKSAPCYDAL